MKPLCIDLFCGYGGWARGFLDAGYRVVGFDNEPKCAKRYPGEFVLADIRSLKGSELLTRYGKPFVVLASPPCTEFSVATVLREIRGLAKRDPYGEMGLGLVYEALRLITEMEPEYWCMENVRGAERFIGPPQGRSGPQSLWGFFPGFIASNGRKMGAAACPPGLPPEKRGEWRAAHKADHRSRDPRQNAIIPYPLARALAEACLP